MDAASGHLKNNVESVSDFINFLARVIIYSSFGFGVYQWYQEEGLFAPQRKQNEKE